MGYFKRLFGKMLFGKKTENFTYGTATLDIHRGVLITLESIATE